MPNILIKVYKNGIQLLNQNFHVFIILEIIKRTVISFQIPVKIKFLKCMIEKSSSFLLHNWGPSTSLFGAAIKRRAGPGWTASRRDTSPCVAYGHVYIKTNRRALKVPSYYGTTSIVR